MEGTTTQEGHATAKVDAKDKYNKLDGATHLDVE
jgi:hypothetical protein